MSTVSFAGFSRLGGALKFRTANSVARITQLRKLGDTDVVILALPAEMSKNDAAKYVLSELASGAYMVDVAEAEALLVATIKDENPFAKKASRTVKVKSAKVARPEPKKITIEEANKLVLATMREMTEAEVLESKVMRAGKARRERRAVEAV